MGNTVVPSPTKVMLEICTQGYGDAIKYLYENGHIKCQQCLARSSLVPDCGFCETRKKELSAKLPEEVLRVFEDEIEKEGNNVRDLSSYIFKLPVAMWQAAFSM